MKVLIVLLVALATVLAEKESADHAERSIILPGFQRNNCQWKAPANPCTINPLGRLNFPHPSDYTKFIQCGAGNRMFVIQCPPGEVYEIATTNCVNKAVLNRPVVNSLAPYGISNPCTQQNILTGNIFFTLPYHANNFIECEPSGNAKVLACPAQTVWDQARLSCVFPKGVNVPTSSLTGVSGNPCTAQAIKMNALFFSHPDPSKFIQCDLQGNAFVQNCPAGLVWNQYLETCVSQLSTYPLIGNQSG